MSALLLFVLPSPVGEIFSFRGSLSHRHDAAHRRGGDRERDMYAHTRHTHTSHMRTHAKRACPALARGVYLTAHPL